MVEWESAAEGAIRPYAWAGGIDVNGETIYVGRAYENGDLVPGKIVTSHGVCYIPYCGEEKAHSTYEFIVTPDNGSLYWIASSKGQSPCNAVQGGRCANGEPLFIGRAFYEGSLVIGKVQESDQVLYVSFDGKEISFSDYELLMFQCEC